MADEIQYRDVDGNPCSLPTLCCRDPGWAASRIRHMTDELSRAQAEIAALRTENERLDAALFQANSLRLQHEASGQRLADLTIDALTSPPCECEGTGTTVGPSGFRLCERCAAESAARAKLKET